MSWDDARRFHRVLREVEAALDAGWDGPLPWLSEYALVFTGPEQLRLALLTRWRTIVEAQSEDELLEDIAAAHPGLARLAGVRTPGRYLLSVAS